MGRQKNTTYFNIIGIFYFWVWLYHIPVWNSFINNKWNRFRKFFFLKNKMNINSSLWTFFFFFERGRRYHKTFTILIIGIKKNAGQKLIEFNCLMQQLIKTHIIGILLKLKNKILNYFPPSHDIWLNYCGFLIRFTL